MYEPIVNNLHWMTWNLLLAAVPAVLAVLVFRPGVARGPTWWCGLAVLVAFLPNSAYVLTDVVHLPAQLRATRADDWALVGVVSEFALLFGLGFSAYALAVTRLEQWLGRMGLSRRVALSVGVVVHLACAVGVFLGRAWRFNSWDLVRRPGDVLAVVVGGLKDPHPRTLAIVGFAWVVFAVGTAFIRALVAVGWRKIPAVAKMR